MSIHDETWDRPICTFCGKTIPYGEKILHGEGKCGSGLGEWVDRKELEKEDARKPYIIYTYEDSRTMRKRPHFTINATADEIEEFVECLNSNLRGSSDYRGLQIKAERITHFSSVKEYNDILAEKTKAIYEELVKKRGTWYSN